MTIEEIANELGVSKSTVSRALSGKGRIGKATIERIQAYVAEHDNLPNQYGEKKAKEEKKMAKTENKGRCKSFDNQMIDFFCFPMISVLYTGSGY